MVGKSTIIVFHLIAFVAFGANAATYKCKDASGKWTEEACRPARSASTSPSASAAKPNIDDPNARAVLEDAFGCQNDSTLDKLSAYKSDPEAMKQFVMLALAAGECTSFSQGEIVLRTDSSFFSERIKIRRRGDLREYWTLMRFVGTLKP